MTGAGKHSIRFLAVSLGGTVLFYLWAFGIVLKRSFAAAGGRFSAGNYLAVLQSRIFWLAAKNTVIFLSVCISLLLTLSLGIAVVLLKDEMINRILKKGFLIPLAIPASATVFLWNVLLDTKGWLNHFLTFFGFSEIDWMHSVWTFWILVIVYIWKNLGYYIILWTSALIQIPSVLYEEARVDGANRWQLFLHLTLPLLRPFFYYILLFSVVSGFQTFREAYIVAGEYPNENIYMLQHLLNNWYRDMDLERLAAATCILAGFLTVLTLVIRRGFLGEERKRK